MSIDDIKKKSKLSLDEMLDNKDVGNTVKQDTVHNVGKPILGKNYINENKVNKLTTTNVKHPCKMTLYMTQEVYDLFNYIYAQRMLKQRKVDKGSLFCEIMQFYAEHGGE